VLKNLFAELPAELQKKNHNIAELFDGDTSSYARRKIRDNPPGSCSPTLKCSTCPCSRTTVTGSPFSADCVMW
jgi:hypothetical protein